MRLLSPGNPLGQAHVPDTEQLRSGSQALRKCSALMERSGMLTESQLGDPKRRTLLSSLLKTDSQEQWKESALLPQLTKEGFIWRLGKPFRLPNMEIIIVKYCGQLTVLWVLKILILFSHLLSSSRVG